LAPEVAGWPLPPDPLCLAAAATPIGAMVPALAGGADCGGAPKPPNPGADGAVVVVVEAPPGQDVDPVPGAHWADGAVVDVVVAFLPLLGFGHFVVGADVGVEPDLFFDFFVVVGVGAAGAAARCSWVWGTAELPATAGVNPATAAVAKVTAATPSRPMLMRNIGTSLFHDEGRAPDWPSGAPAAMGTPQGTVLSFCAGKGTSCPTRHELAQEGVKGSAEVVVPSSGRADRGRAEHRDRRRAGDGVGAGGRRDRHGPVEPAHRAGALDRRV
jgi:hypothetical protein